MNIPLYGDAYRKLYGNMTTLYPSAQDSPNMTIKITAGGFWSFLNGIASYVEYIGGSSPMITAPIGNAKWVVVALNSAGMVVNINGAEAASPVLPVIPSNRYPIALVYVQFGDTVLTNEYIFDARPIFSNPVRSHLDLTDRIIEGAHPISAITGLADIISIVATLANLEDGLAGKADIVGTSESRFKLNQDHTGTPSSDAYFEVERGSGVNVSIMWDESGSSGVWKYTNNGSDWYELSGSYYNDGSQDIMLKVYNQISAPTLGEGKAGIWIDSDDSNKTYLVFKPVGLTQVKVEMT